MLSNPSAYRELVYTGPVDEFFDYRFGKLPYRSLQFRHETMDVEKLQPVAVINYPNEHDYTRVTEFKHLTGQSTRRPAWFTNIRATKAILTIPCRVRKTQPSTSNMRRWPLIPRRAFHRPACDLQVLQHGSGGRPGVDTMRETIGSNARRTGSQTSPRLNRRDPEPATAQIRSELISRMALRIEFHSPVIGHQAVYFLLHIVKLGVADAGDLRNTGDSFSRVR